MASAVEFSETDSYGERPHGGKLAACLLVTVLNHRLSQECLFCCCFLPPPCKGITCLLAALQLTHLWDLLTIPRDISPSGTTFQRTTECARKGLLGRWSAWIPISWHYRGQGSYLCGFWGLKTRFRNCVFHFIKDFNYPLIFQIIKRTFNNLITWNIKRELADAWMDQSNAEDCFPNYVP